MTNSHYYAGRGSFMSADLKRMAHAVRMKIDNTPVYTDPSGREVNPRKRRLVSIPSDDSGFVIVAPHLDPAARHAMAWKRRS